MPMTDVLILANSTKLSGRCVAGLVLSTETWVRPVVPHGSGALNVHQTKVRWSEGLHEAEPLDVISMNLGAPKPSSYHPEDVLRGSEEWAGVEVRSAASVLEDLDPVLTSGPTVLGSIGDRLSLSEIDGSEASHRSLALVHPNKVSFSTRASISGNPQVRANFELAGVWYNLAVTDVRCSPGKLPREGDYLLTISLAVPFRPTGASEDFCFKIVAGVIPLT